MTCIVGLVDGDTVWMGGDSAAVSDRHYLFRTSQPKVFLNGGFLFGYTTSFRMGQLLQYQFKPPFPPGPEVDLLAFMATEFVTALRALFREHGWLRKECDRETGGIFLVGTAARLFVVDDDFNILEPLEGHASVGSGTSVADGSLYSTAGLISDPVRRLSLALEASTKFVTSVEPPFHFEKLARRRA